MSNKIYFTQSFLYAVLLVMNCELGNYFLNWGTIFQAATFLTVAGCGCHISSYCARDCADIQDLGFNSSGVYRIYPGNIRNGLEVFCDMETDGGGWLVFQRRTDGAENFTKKWNKYQYGFGDVSGEHWLGNMFLNIITSQSIYQLRVDLEDWNGTKSVAKYYIFKVGDISQNYSLVVEGYYQGKARNSLHRHNGRPFSTYDRDTSLDKCAGLYQSGWWFAEADCVIANLNGFYFPSGNADNGSIGIIWRLWKGESYSLKTTEMKIRRL